MNLPERITDAEERIRDRALKPILDLLIPDWVYPNHITGLRIVLVSTAIIFYLISTSLAIQFWVLCAAALTDFIDGPWPGCGGSVHVKGLNWMWLQTGI